MNDEDDRRLVRRCRGGERAAFEQLVVRYQKPVFNAALRLLRDPEDASDVAQTTFLKAFEHLGKYNPDFKFYSWLYRIAINEALDVLNSRTPADGISDEEPDGQPGPERRAEGEQMGRAIEDALMRIKPDLRTVIVLRHFMHLSYEDMGEILMLPEKTVKSRLHSARQLMRDQLFQYAVS
ncbi:MAG TPA: sigma-70 family RNA polymerase sigma factor [Steroidobacteraceae bacterium]|nr:sigma-70 family RNA polymerase sigma factor [Steroidobacteraceae bacterium]